MFIILSDQDHKPPQNMKLIPYFYFAESSMSKGGSEQFIGTLRMECF